MSEQERLRLKRSGGPGSPGTTQSEWMQKFREKTQTVPPSPAAPQTEPESKEPSPVKKPVLKEIRPSDPPLTISEADSWISNQKKEEKKTEPLPPVPADKVYNIELIIYTVSGHKYSARLNFKDDVARGALSEEDAKTLIAKTENDLKNRTFQRPITYSEKKGAGAAVEYIFNPDNVECITITRLF